MMTTYPTSCFYAFSTFLHSFKAPHSPSSAVAQNQSQLVQNISSSPPDPIHRSMTRRGMRSSFSICPMSTPLGLRWIVSHLLCTAVRFSLTFPRCTDHVRPSVPPPNPCPRSWRCRGLFGAPLRHACSWGAPRQCATSRRRLASGLSCWRIVCRHQS